MTERHRYVLGSPAQTYSGQSGSDVLRIERSKSGSDVLCVERFGFIHDRETQICFGKSGSDVQVGAGIPEAI